MKIDEALVTLTRDRAAALVGISERKVDYWARTGLVQPTIDHRLTPQRPVRLYGYVDLMSLMVAAELRARGVSLQHIRQVVNHFRDRGYDKPLTELVWATMKDRIYFQHPGGEWESDAVPDQLVMREVLDLEVLRARIRRAVQRDAETVGRTERVRGVRSSRPVIAGTRVPVDTIQRYLANGASTQDVLSAYPVLEAEDVEAVRQLAAV